MEPLTPRQKLLHDYLCSRWQDPPSYREIMAHMRIGSTNGVLAHLRALEKKGYVQLPDQTRSRGIVLLVGPDLTGDIIDIAGRSYRLTALTEGATPPTTRRKSK